MHGAGRSGDRQEAGPRGSAADCLCRPPAVHALRSGPKNKTPKEIKIIFYFQKVENLTAAAHQELEPALVLADGAQKEARRHVAAALVLPARRALAQPHLLDLQRGANLAAAGAKRLTNWGRGRRGVLTSTPHRQR